MVTVAMYLLTVLTSVTQSAAGKKFSQIHSDPMLFNAIKACTALAFFAGMACFGFTFHPATVLFGLGYGGLLCLSMYMGYRALCLGPMALTGMLVSFSVVIPLLFGVTIGGETLTRLQGIALILLIVSMVLINADKIKAGEKKETEYGKWLLFVGLTFVCNGICSVLQKQHQARYPGLYSKEFMLIAMLLCAIVFAAIALSKHSVRDWRLVKGKRYGVLSGVANGLSGFLTLVLAGSENASVLFPVISIGTTLAALLCGRWFFGEKLKCNHVFALLVGTVAVVLLKW